MPLSRYAYGSLALAALAALGCGATPASSERAPPVANTPTPAHAANTPQQPKTTPLAAAKMEEPARGTATREAVLGVRDTGVFSDLDPRVQLHLPQDLSARRVSAAVDEARAQLVLYDGTQPIKAYPLRGPNVLNVGNVTLALRAGDVAELAPLLTPERMFVFERPVELPPGDADGDGLPDPLDVLIGAHKAVLNADRYDGRYEKIPYPGGDVPREIGVCTDVIIRSLRNAGYDLQQLVHEDIVRAPRAYPMIRKPNTDIDHRRVKSLLPYFERTADKHTAALDDASDPLQPGDVIFMDTFGDRPGSEHVGVISELASPEGKPLVINNWTDGTVTRPMNLLAFVPVTERFRLPARLPERGPISALRTQLVTVTSDDWKSTKGTLRRYEREPGRSWREVGNAMPVVLGHAGYGWGDGLHGAGPPASHGGPVKREGDGRSPAGVFEFGTVYGYADRPADVSLPYAAAGAALRCVDDASSKHYNEILAEPARASWRSAERMRRDDDLYELALVVRHNSDPIIPGHGSCIFVHVWQTADTPVTGCTALDKASLRTLITWLRPNAAVMAALPVSEYAALRREWGLP